MRRLAALGTAAALALALAGCGGDPAPDDAALHAAITGNHAGTEVTFDGALTDNPVDAGGHERFHVRAGSGDVLEVDHNISLATEVPAHQGDSVVIHGQLYIDPGAVGVHCTHAHTSSGCPEGGWIKFAGSTYQ
jgi:hypothetical protein